MPRPTTQTDLKPITTSQRDNAMREIAGVLRELRALPIKNLPEDAHHTLITARNFLKGILVRASQ